MKGCAPPIKVQEMAPLLPKVEEATIMPFPLRRVMATPPHGEEDLHLLPFEKEGGSIVNK